MFSGIFAFPSEMQPNAEKCCPMPKSCHYFGIMRIQSKRGWNNGKRVWVVDLRCLGLGRRFFKDKREADIEARSRQTELENHGARAFDLTDQDRTEFLAAKDRLAEVGSTITEAVEFFLRAGPVREKKTIPQAVT